MMNPEHLKKAADDALGGLTAGPALLHRARRKAAGREAAPARRAMPRALAFALSLALVAGVTAGVLVGLQNGQTPTVNTMQAGETLHGNFRSVARDVPRGSLVLSTDPSPAYQGVWAAGSGANFPLIRHDGRYYRLLTHPADAAAVLGGKAGEVSVFTSEPALDSGSSTLSNVASQGAAVYRVSGMGNSALAAQVNGTARLFQRVSFAGSALVGGEDLADVLPRGAAALQLSGVGTVTDSSEVARLMDILYSTAVNTGSSSRETGQALLVQYPSGITLQMAVSADTLYGCGAWSSPEFMEEFKAAAK